MRSRRVPVLKLGSRVQEATKSRCVYVRQAFASVRKSSQAFASVGECRASSGVANRRETQNCRHFWTRLASSRLKSVNSHSDGGGGGPRRETQNCRHFGLVLHLRVSKVSTVTGIGGGSSSRNAEPSSLLDLSCIFASQKCQRSQGSGGGPRRETQNRRHFGVVSRLRV